MDMHKNKSVYFLFLLFSCSGLFCMDDSVAVVRGDGADMTVRQDDEELIVFSRTWIESAGGQEKKELEDAVARLVKVSSEPVPAGRKGKKARRAKNARLNKAKQALGAALRKSQEKRRKRDRCLVCGLVAASSRLGRATKDFKSLVGVQEGRGGSSRRTRRVLGGLSGSNPLGTRNLEDINKDVEESQRESEEARRVLAELLGD